MDDTIYRQAAIDALNRHLDTIRVTNNSTTEMIRRSEVMDCREIINGLPSAQPKPCQNHTQKAHESDTLGVKTVETCSDTISRKAAIDALEKVAELFPWRVPGNRDSYDRYNEAWNDAIGRAEIEIEKLPSAQPELEPKREKGHWQISDAYPHNVYCSECHARFAQTHWAVWEDGSLPRRFCPNCGANMTGDVESRL